ncbi:Detected protein of unknown function [Hibiscus syriacus]|uniref:BHLH domain-containing protein n=1 Tax=Hibiscus syriacus TaxID=106335 RepID=A0A6A2YSA8_HIBSY|nr:Detected protein of unknown function [Hibiscus syriacus]
MDDSLYELFEEGEFGPGGDDLFSFFESFDGTQNFHPSLLWKKRPPLATRKTVKKLRYGQQRMSHITVERNRRKQMNEHLSVHRSLMPCFYDDQASIIGGVVDNINELQQVLQSLEAKKQRKVINEVLSPRVVSSPRPSPLSPRKPPLSPRLNLPISPRTPQPGPSLTLKTVSPPIPGQAVKIISALEDTSMEILSVNINTIDDIMLNSYTIKLHVRAYMFVATAS